MFNQLADSIKWDMRGNKGANYVTSSLFTAAAMIHLKSRGSAAHEGTQTYTNTTYASDLRQKRPVLETALSSRLFIFMGTFMFTVNFNCVAHLSISLQY